MSALRSGDDKYHYSDHSHRWVCPLQGVDQAAWEASVRAHVDEHTATMGGPAAEWVAAEPSRESTDRRQQRRRSA